MMNTSTDTLSRQWTMLRHIPASPNKISTTDLHNYLRGEGYEVVKRTIQRDLEKLSGSLFPLTSEKEGRENYWYYINGPTLDLPAMTPATAMVFQLAKQHLDPLLPRSTLALIQSYVDRAEEVLRDTRFHGWRKDVRMLGHGPQLIPPKVNDKVRDTVYEALFEKKRFKTTYRPRQRDPIEYVVNPLGLVFRQGISYLVCTLWDYRDFIQLALHRMQSPELLDEDSVRIRDFNLDTYIYGGENFAYPLSSERLELKIRMKAEAAFHLHESKLSRTQVITPVDEDTVEITATLTDSMEIRWWLLSFGDKVEVLEPKFLRDEFARIAANLNQRYA